MNMLYNLPDELIEYIFSILHKNNYLPVLKELEERTILRNDEKVHEIVENFVEQLLENVIGNMNQQL